MNSDQLAIILWNYHHVGHRPEKADVIFALGSHDLDVARYATQLYLNGWSPLLAFSGGVAHQGDELNTGWNKPEAEMFADIAMGMGVPKEKILIENKASNTGENFTRMEEVFKERDINPQTVLLVQKPYMERRTIATGRMRWPDRNLTVTSAPISFEAYTSGGIKKEKMCFSLSTTFSDLLKLDQKYLPFSDVCLLLLGINLLLQTRWVHYKNVLHLPKRVQ